MSYRLLLEVPDRLVDQANIAVGLVGDAQVLLARNSHGLTFDDPYQDLSVAAHSLSVVYQLFDWVDGLDHTRDRIAIVLHSGQRLLLPETPPDVVVAAIRHDQPWVEPSIPKIGEHVEDELAPDDWPVPPVDTTGELMAAEDMPEIRPDSTDIVVEGSDYPVVRVNNLKRAEDFYIRVFGLQVQRRFRFNRQGSLIEVEGQPDWLNGDRLGVAPVLSFLSNDRIRIALRNVGIGIRLDLQSFANRLAATVDPDTLTRVRAEVLMGGHTLLSQSDDSLTFRDPMGVTWDLTTREIPKLASAATAV